MSEEHAVTADVASPVRAGDRHFVTDMDATVLLATETRCVLRAPLTAAVRSPAGSAALGTLVTLADVGASDPAMVACRPDWTATQDLMLHGARPITEGPIVVDSQLVRVGKKVVVVAVSAYDGHGVDDLDVLRSAIDDLTAFREGAVTLGASGLVTFVRLPRAAAPGRDDYDPAQWVGETRSGRAGTPATGTLHERMGLRTVDGSTGELELGLTPYVVNSIGTVNGGAQAVMVDAAAEALRPEMVATDVHIHFLSQVRTGPIRSLGTVLRDATDHTVVMVRLIDTGNENALLTLATVTLQTRAP
jgi:acyl-coenzyme A thioesterase PaaI-like protein